MSAGTYKSDLVTIDVDILARTDRAVHVLDHESGKRVWLPLSQVEVSPSDGEHHVVDLPEWLAIEKELI